MTYLNLTFGDHKVVTLVLFVFLTITNDKLHAQDNINFGDVVDVSISANRTIGHDAKTKLKKIVSMLDLVNSNAKVTLCTSVIGSAAIPKVNVATLEGSSHFSSVHERRQNLAAFLSKALSDLEFQVQPATHQNTQIFRTLCALASRLDPEADTTILVITSDFISSGPVTVEFSSYAKDPSKLMDQYDRVLDDFKADSPLPDLLGAQVILVTPEDSENHELTLWASRVWKRAMLEHFGAGSVEIRVAF